MNHGRKSHRSQRPRRLPGPCPQHVWKERAVSDQGFHGLMQPHGCVIHRRVQELHGRGGWGLAASPWQQRPVMWDISCSGLGKLGQALRSFSPQQPRQGGSLRDVSFQKHGAATHGKGHTGPTGGKGGKLAWLTPAGSYSRASGKSRLLPRKDVSPCSRLCFSPSPPRAVRLRSRPHDVRCEGALRRGRRD